MSRILQLISDLDFSVKGSHLALGLGSAMAFFDFAPELIYCFCKLEGGAMFACR